MAKRQTHPPANKAGGISLDPVASAPGLAVGLAKYFTAQLVALTGGTMDAPVCEPGSPLSDAGAPGLEAARLPVQVRRTRFVRHRRMSFLTKAEN